MDHLINRVEDRLLGLDDAGIHRVECSKFFWNFGDVLRSNE